MVLHEGLEPAASWFAAEHSIPDLRTLSEAAGPNLPTAGRRDRTDPSYGVFPC